MKHRWLAAVLLATLVLGACRPAEGGPGPSTSTPAPADFYDDY